MSPTFLGRTKFFKTRNSVIIEVIVQTERPLSEREIKTLRRHVKQLDKQKSFQVKFLFIWILLAILVGTFAYFFLNTTTELYLLIGTVVVYILMGTWSFLETYLKQRKERKDIDFVFATNEVKSIQVIGNEYIELSEVEDEGVNYLFQISDN